MNVRELESILRRIDGRGYKAYKELERKRFSFPFFYLHIDHVQGDPYASPSRLRARIPASRLALPDWAYAPEARRRATRDFLARWLRSAFGHRSALKIDAGAQTVLDRSCAVFVGKDLEIRFFADLPAAGRRILGFEAIKLLCQELPAALSKLLPGKLNIDGLKRHCDVVEDQVAIRAQLSNMGLVAFVGDGSILPRKSGVDDSPAGGAVPFKSPPTLRVEVEVPNAGKVKGMGIPKGITIIVGGGFHGKSTLLRAIELGVYDHIPGDGRELVVTVPDAVKIRAEDGRSVSCVDISPFISDLPYGKSTKRFSTELASGSTSQASALVEALESGASLLLVDEDTSATNFMIRDERMQALVVKEKEPITPFVDRIRELRDNLDVSTILVMGGSGDYLDHADCVIQMDSYIPRDVTSKAREVVEQHKTRRKEEHPEPLKSPVLRRLDPSSLKPETKPGKIKIKAGSVDSLLFGRSTVDLRAVEQIVDSSQVRAIGWIMVRLSRLRGPVVAVEEIKKILSQVESEGWDSLTGRPMPDLAAPRLFEVMAALNRLRGVRFSYPTR